MFVLYALGQLIFLLAGNAAVLVGLVFPFRWRRLVLKKRTVDNLEGVRPALVSPIEFGWSVLEFSRALLHLLVGETPRSKSRSGQGPSRSVFFLLLPSVCMSILPTPTHAQSPTPSITLSPLHVDAPDPSCVDVEVEGTRQPAFDCLNEELKAAAEGAAPTDSSAALNTVVGNAEPNKVGTFSRTGESIRMGNAFGKSAFPQRPAAPVYANPLIAGIKP